MTPEQAQTILHEYRLRMREAAVAWRRVHADEHSAWTFETVKHLAFVNAAGLAGAAALYAAPDLGKRIVGPCGVPIALLFALGLVMAVLDMYLNSLGALARLKELDSRLKIWDKRNGPASTVFRN
ncbi:hypothetical protein [Cupriavidus plantarum]|uniref:hypothetical protein n=1 Tax=Cupriavidus plantarum TaxID=942865 RepID=UPI00339D65E5